MADVTTTSNGLNGAWIREIMQQLTVNQNALKAKLNIYNHQSVKMLSIEWFTGDRLKLKGFFTQVKI